MGKKIAIVGAGAVGAHIAGYLTRDGHLTVIDIWPAHVEAMRTRRPHARRHDRTRVFYREGEMRYT